MPPGRPNFRPPLLIPPPPPYPPLPLYWQNSLKLPLYHPNPLHSKSKPARKIVLATGGLCINWTAEYACRKDTSRRTSARRKPIEYGGRASRKSSTSIRSTSTSPLPPKWSAMLISVSPVRSWVCSKVPPLPCRLLPRVTGTRSVCGHRCDLPARRVLRNQSHRRYLNLHPHRRYHPVHSAYTEWINKIGTHHIVGWYHSHPSFGCWLSGIDVATQ